MSSSLILDSGACIAIARGNRTVRERVYAALQAELAVIVPPIVVTQVLRGGERDAPINLLLKRAGVPIVDLALAREAGYLLRRAALRDAADAQVMAEALRGRPSILLTSDPDDMRRLLDGQPGVEIVAV